MQRNLLVLSGLDNPARRRQTIFRLSHMSQYKKLWQKIQKAEAPVKVRCPAGHQATLIQAVRQYKAKVNVNRKAMDLPAYGMLKVKVIGDMLEFELSYNGDQF